MNFQALQKIVESASHYLNESILVLHLVNATQAVTSGAAQAVIPYLDQTLEDKIRIAAAWALSRIARHGKETAQPIAEANVLPELLKMYMGTPPARAR